MNQLVIDYKNDDELIKKLIDTIKEMGKFFPKPKKQIYKSDKMIITKALEASIEVENPDFIGFKFTIKDHETRINLPIKEQNFGTYHNGISGGFIEIFVELDDKKIKSITKEKKIRRKLKKDKKNKKTKNLWLNSSIYMETTFVNSFRNVNVKYVSIICFIIKGKTWKHADVVRIYQKVKKLALIWCQETKTQNINYFTFALNAKVILIEQLIDLLEIESKHAVP